MKDAKSNHYKRWTELQDKALIHMYHMEYAVRAMALQLGRTETSVTSRLVYLRSEGRLAILNPPEDNEDDESAITMMEAHKAITPPRHVSTEEWVWHGFFFLTGALMTFSLMQIIGT